MSESTLRISEPDVEYWKTAESINLLQHIEKIGRTCYKSDDKITDSSYESFIKRLIDSGHHAMLEHISLTLSFKMPRSVSHEAVRHRLCAFAQTSTRYVNYSKDKFGNGIEVIRPFYFDIDSPRREITFPISIFNYENIKEVTFVGNEFDIWLLSMEVANWAYLALTTDFGRQAQEARAVLPLSTATNLVITANPREWRHILELRSLGTTGSPHPEIRKLMDKALDILNKEFPILFNDLYLRRFENK